MKTLINITIITLFLALPLTAKPVFDVAGKCPSGCMPGKIEVGTIEGTNYCVTCGLKGEFDAKANCMTFGHHHALKVASMIDGCGENCEEFNGKTLHYIENEQSVELLKGHKDVKMKVKGKVFIDSGMIEVESFEVVDK